MKVKFLEIDEEEAEKQTTLSILQFIEKVISYLKLYNVRIIFSEDTKLELKLEKILSKVVHLQGLLIASKAKDNQEVMASIGQLRNEIKHDFNDSFSS
jgi:hypothetical protein